MQSVAVDRPPPPGITRRQSRVALSVSSLLLAAVAFVAGTAAHAPAPDPVQTRHEVPVGVQHSPAGAVAAADDYVATEQATVERDPTRFAALVSEDYAGALRASALVEAAADRKRDPRGMRLWADGGESFTTVGAHRLDWYRDNSAQVTVWVGQVFWGPGQPPCQVWGLTRATIVWGNRHWQVTSMDTAPGTAPAPARLPQASPEDDSSARFSSELAGFSSVSYGSAQ